MTLRHVVCWKMNGATREERETQMDEACAAIEPLRERIPSVRALNIYRNELHEGVNHDLILVTDFDDADGLAEYAVHPEHQPAIALMKRITASRVAVDFTV